ncbi:hypothetical protein CFN58_29895 [Pseudomonas avellanae]|nr:hypothetical protein CFN58_29895 [Pseudomonas avellanae]GAO95252.1 hypothetical protein PSA5_21065 [Pseudomonas syringae pv. actinidiae]
MTTELLKGAGAQFESTASRDLSRAISDLEGFSFIDPSNAGVPGVSPASITNSVAAIEGGAGALGDIRKLLDAFKGDLETAVFIASPRAGLALHDAGYDGAGALGGDVAGIPLVTSSVVPDWLVALIDPAGILVADEGVLLDMSEQSTLVAADGTVLNLYQENMAAIKAERILNWSVERAGSVIYLIGANW